MSQKESIPPKGRNLFYSIVAIGVIALGAALFPRLFPARDFFSPIGIVHASESEQQKDREGPAKTGASASDGTEAFRELVGKLATDKEFLSALAARIRKVEERERELDRREKDLSLLQIDIMSKLQELEKIRGDLKAMTDRIDADAKKTDKLREQQISDAVRNFKALGPEAAAESMLQMDLESGVIILRQLTGQTVGGIFDAMVEIVNAGGTDSELKKEKMAQLWEYLVNPGKPFPEVASTEPKPK